MMAFLTEIVTKLINVHVKYLILYDFKQNLNSTNFRKISNGVSLECSETLRYTKL
jgi:hypothetical protein